jgi:iron complex transport system ATP-binding protein
VKLAATRVEVRLGRKPVLRGIDAAVGAGELLGLIGANGAGKSTAMRVLAGLLRPEQGEVRFDGTPADRLGPARLALLRSYLPQEPVAHWSLTAADVVRLGRLPHRDRWSDDAAVERAMRRTGTLAFASRRIDTLSAGERMRVLLARALSVEAPILLADEPTAGLDPLQQLRIMQLLRELAEEGGTVLAVLHDLTLAARFCTRLVLLHEGHVLADGPPGDVLSDGNLARAYGVTVRRAGELIVPWAPLI